MKLLTIILALCLFGCMVNAQSLAMKNPNGLNIDTATQALAKGPSLRVGASKVIGVVLNTTYISGTVAGTVSWQGSDDGVSWYTISTTALVSGTSPAVYGYKEVDCGFPFYRALITQTGTSSMSFSAKLYKH